MAKKFFIHFRLNMRVDNSKLSFKSGLTKTIRREVNSIDVSQTERYFRMLGTKAHFYDNKVLCGCAKYTADIMAEISYKYHLPFYHIPPEIIVYEETEKSNIRGFCTTINKKYGKRNKEFIGGSIFFKDTNQSIDDINQISTWGKFTNFSSSSHFLSDFIHEWSHLIHFYSTYEKYGYNGKGNELKKKFNLNIKQPCGLSKLQTLQNEEMPQDIKDYIFHNFGLYATKDYIETFPELMTKIITESLDEKLRVVYNPLSKLPKDLPKRLKKLLEEVGI